MNLKKKRIIVAFVILNMISIPWIMIHNALDIENVLKYIKELALFEFAIISLIIAVSVFDQFGLNKKLTEKKVELIIELLTELKNQKGFGTHYEIKGKFFSNPAFYFGKDMAKTYTERLTKMGSDIARVLNSRFTMDGNDFDEAFKKIKTVLNHPLMPSSIVEKAQFIKLSGGTGGKIVEDASEMTYVYFTENAKQKLIKKDRKYWFFAGNNDCTVLEFLKKFDELFNACEEWANRHSNINEKLNLEEFN